MADMQRIGLDEVIPHFEVLEDPRSAVNWRHPLVSGVVITRRAVLAGAGGPTAIARWAALKEEFLREALPLPNGIPRQDVLRRVLMALKPGAFPACFANWLQSLRAQAAAATGGERPGLAVDARRRGGATTASTAWGRGMPSASGPAPSACRWAQGPVPRSRTRSRPSPRS